jgi:hypothetical protein
MHRGKQKYFILQESLPQLKQGIVTKIFGLYKLLKIKEFTCFDNLKIGQMAVLISQIPHNSLYYQLATNTKKKLVELRKLVKTTFKIEVKKNLFYYLRLIKMTINIYFTHFFE